MKRENNHGEGGHVCPSFLQRKHNMECTLRKRRKKRHRRYLFFLRLQADTGVTLYEHESIREFYRKYSRNVHNLYLMSQKDIGKEENLMFKPFYLMPFLIDE